MIRKLRIKLTVLTTISIFLLMTVLVSMMNIINYTSVISECDDILNVLVLIEDPSSINDKGFIDIPDTPEDSKNQDMPDSADPADEKKNNPDNPANQNNPFVPRGMSPEVPYESRFFEVKLSGDGTVTDSDFSRILSVDESSVNEYVDKATSTSSNRGNINQFRFLKTEDGDGTRILFLDCGRKFDAFKTFLLTSLAVGFGGCVAVFLIFLLASQKIVKPIAESYEKQKRFISDAGHEIKTPLTIISANVDLLEIDGEKDELTEIRAQTKRLSELTNELVFLSKMQESEQHIQKIEFPFSDMVSETVNSFSAPVTSHNITCNLAIQPNITLNGAPDALRRLICVLTENAVKYTPGGGTIDINLSVQKKNVIFSIKNTTRENISQKDLSHIFERFYRTDASRNSETGGHGIGLSIAKAVAEAHGGNIAASTDGGNDFTVTVSLPLS